MEARIFSSFSTRGPSAIFGRAGEDGELDGIDGVEERSGASDIEILRGMVKIKESERAEDCSASDFLL